MTEKVKNLNQFKVKNLNSGWKKVEYGVPRGS